MSYKNINVDTINWVTPGSGGGDVSGPSSSIVNHIVTFSDTSGKTIKDSGLSAQIVSLTSVISSDTAMALVSATNTNNSLVAQGTGAALLVAGGASRVSALSTGVVTIETGPLLVQAGVAATPSLGFAVDAGTGIYRAASHELAISCGGTESLRVTSDRVESRGGVVGTGFLFLGDLDTGIITTVADNDMQLIVGNENRIAINDDVVITAKASTGSVSVTGDGGIDLNGTVQIAGAFYLPAVDGTNGQTLITNGSGSVAWGSGGGGSGDVTGPGSATDNALVRFDTTSGKLIQNSIATLSDAGLLTTNSIDVAEVTIAAAGIETTATMAAGQNLTIAGANNQNISMTVTGSGSVKVSAAGTKIFQVDPNGVEISNSYVLPTADGNADDVMSTDGAGVVRWVAPTGGSLPTTAIVPYSGFDAFTLYPGQSFYACTTVRNATNFALFPTGQFIIAQHDYGEVTFVARAGSYWMTVTWAGGGDRGIASFSVNGGSSIDIDAYTVGINDNQSYTASVTLIDGDNTLALTVQTKNVLSSGYAYTPFRDITFCIA
jgi:hypothetical protein